MGMGMQRRRMAAVIAVGALAVSASVMVLGQGVSAAAAPEKEFSSSFEPTCVVDPGILNIVSKVKLALRASVPSTVAPGETFTIKKSSATITTPVALTEDFRVFGATEVKGVATDLPVEVTNAEPGKANIAKPAEFPEGLPFFAPVEKGKESVFNIPSLALGETGRTYTVGTWKVTASSGAVTLVVSTEPGFTEPEHNVFKATGGGIVTEKVEGLKEGKLQIGPLAVLCNAPSGTATLEIPIASATPPIGRPVLYQNGKLVENASNPTAMYASGELGLESESLGGTAGCVTMGFGAGFNEGSPPHRGLGAVFGFGSGGHPPGETGKELSASCSNRSGQSSPPAFVTAESWAASESNPTTGKFETSLRRESTPWDAEAICVIQEGEFKSAVRIGVPTSEYPRPQGTCPPKPSTEPEEPVVGEHATDRVERKGCYASNPAPAGCLKVTVVEPAAGLEAAFGGTLVAFVTNGVKNGLSPSHLEFLGRVSGQLECEFPSPCPTGLGGVVSGELKVSGYSDLALMQLRLLKPLEAAG